MRTSIAFVFALVLCSGCSWQSPKRVQVLPWPELRKCPSNGERARFDSDGHMLTTFIIARIATVPEQDAYRLTYYSQLPDMDPRYDATDVAFKYMLVPWKWGWRRDVMAKLHSLHGGGDAEVQQRRAELAQLLQKKLASKDANSLEEAGLLIHALGDSYAHTKGEFQSGKEEAYGSFVGHGLLGHHPDEIAHADVFPKYDAYVRRLYKLLDPREKDHDSLEEYLCSLAKYRCGSEQNCDSNAVELMERAISTWGKALGKFDWETFNATQPKSLEKERVQKTLAEIK